MVTLQAHTDEQMLILQPNRSASWSANLALLLAVTVVSLAIAVAFAVMGAWLILPFAGLEISALAWALYWVSWKLQYRQVLHFQGTELRIEKGFYHPKQIWCWQRGASSIQVDRQAHALDPLQISLCHGGDAVPVGEFLNREDSERLLSALRKQGLPVRGYSTAATLEI